jgi:hypothetical protein
VEVELPLAAKLRPGNFAASDGPAVVERMRGKNMRGDGGDFERMREVATNGG